MKINLLFTGIILLVFVSCGKDDVPVKETSPIEAAVSWPQKTPQLKVEGKFLKDPCGNKVSLHGVAITPSPWFNGGAVGEWRWNNYDVPGCLQYNNAIIDKLSDAKQDWYLNYVRLHIDPYWTNNLGVSGISENDISQFNFERFKTAVDKVILPLIAHAKTRGMYVILRPPGVCPEQIAVGEGYQDYLKLVWDYVSKHPSLKNADNVMFELANEPIKIKLTDGSVGANTQAHFDQLKLFFQPIVNMIRTNGANNILWIPGSGWQSQYKGYAVNPIEGTNIGYAVHIYPGYWGKDNNDPMVFRANWNENIKPVADIAPIAVTEIDWAPDQYAVWGKGGVTGKPGQRGFGANFKVLVDESGNVSWNLLSPENLIDKGSLKGGIAYNSDPEACAFPVHNWFKEYAKKLVICNAAK
nr:cellulase family glycosylhydrolase [uncultured Flavobacterium sp.]